MPNIVTPDNVAKADNISFKTTKTLRNATLNISSYAGSGYFISVKGRIYGDGPAGTSATVTLEGGLDTFVNAKKVQDPMFYITINQKLALYNILKVLAGRNPNAQVSGDSESLDLLVNAIYANYCG